MKQIIEVNQFCDKCDKKSESLSFVGYDELCPKCAEEKEEANWRAEMKAHDEDAKIFEQMTPDEQQYQISIGYGQAWEDED